MRLFVNHRTEYRFSEPQSRVVQLLRVTPQSYDGQIVVDWRIEVDCDARLKRGRDGYGNEIAMLYVNGPTDGIGFAVTGELSTEDRAGVVIGAMETLPPAYYLQSTPLSRACAAIRELAEEVRHANADALSQAHALCEAVHEKLRFDSDRPDTDRDASTVLEEGHGIGQDYAHVLTAAARCIGLPARFVSGHRYCEGDNTEQAPHGWAEIHVENYGWIGFDAASNLCPQGAYVRVAIGLDYREAAPVSGARIGGGRESLDIGVKVGLSQAQVQS